MNQGQDYQYDSQILWKRGEVSFSVEQKLPPKIVDTPTLEVFNKNLDSHLSKIVGAPA